MRKRKQIIVGSGTAALSALKQLRKAGCDDEVTVLAMETHAPYSPMSLPYVVAGKVTQSDIRMVADDFFDRMGAVFIRGRKVVAIEPAGRRAVCEDGGSEGYDRLLIATGSDPVIPPVLQECGAMGFHVMDDCVTLVERLEVRRKVAIVGAGLVAMELGAALKVRGHEVTIIAPRERVLRSYFDEEAGARIADLFAASGVAVNLNWGEAVAAERHGNEKRVRFARDETVETDVLLACIGVKARVSFLKGSGIDVNAGVVVDRHMRTNVPDVFAAGDVAEAADFFTGRNTVNPILPSAVSQGKIAGSNMADQAAEYEGSLPMNTFNFFGHLALSIGRGKAAEGDDTLIERENGSYKKLIFDDDTLVGAAFLDVDVDAGVFQHLIRKRIPVGKYREMLLEAPREVGFWLINEAEKRETLSREE